MANLVSNPVRKRQAASGVWRSRAASFFSGGRSSLSVPIVVAVLLILLPSYYSGQYWLREGALIATLALVVSGVNLSFGYAGELQLGQVFMFAAGAYFTMILAVHGYDEVVVLMLIGGVVAVLVGIVVALSAMRLGGWSLAMASFFLVVTIPDVTSILTRYTGGLNGLTGIPFPVLFGHPLGSAGMYEVSVVALIIWLACYRNLVTSRYGVVFRTLRESPILTRSLGYSTVLLKTVVYALGAFPAGVAGCLFGYLSLIVQPSSFGLTLGIGLVAASVLGGTESVYGVVIGAAVLQLAPEKSVSFANYAPVAYGLFLVIAATVLRGGIGGLGKSAVGRLARIIEPAAGGGNVGRRPRPAVADTLDAALLPGPDGVRGPEATARPDAVPDMRLPGVTGKRLTVKGVGKAFGGVKALQDVSVTAEPGEVTALIGSNGSGKTTLLNVICGYIRADSGAVTIDDTDVSHLKPHQVARLGVGRTFQTPTIPRGVSVRDVVASGRYSRDHVGFAAAVLRLPRYWRSQREDRREAMKLLSIVGLEHLADADAAKLPLGTRRLVEVIRALCGQPGLVLLDEPASGLNDEEAVRLAAVVRAVAAAGAAVIVIEHNFRFITSVSQTAHVLHLGRVIASGSPEKVAQDRGVVEAYLGEASQAEPVGVRRESANGVGGQADGPLLLEVTGVESGYGDLRVLRGVSLSVRPSTIEVVLGRNGVGKTTLLGSIAGLLPVWKGSVTLAGRPVNRSAAYRRAASGITLVQEGKRIFRQRTVWQNVMLGTYSLRLGRGERQQLCRDILDGFPILRERASQRAGGLSGGQQQMLAIAQALASRPKILLLDEPSAGLAPAIVDELFGRLRRLVDDGLTILLVEQLADKALAIADHVTVLDDGKVVAEGGPARFDEVEKLERAYFGLRAGA
jgi:ABC-type branched-subunit amino acid transport system ATPase component/ABC-type branched-subunit amino acid transport system permease subunit